MRATRLFLPIVILVATLFAAACAPIAPAAPPPPPPRGSLDLVARNADASLTVAGWSAMAAGPTTITVKVLVNNALATQVAATVNRPDVATVFPLAGGLHGYSVTVPASSGVLNGAFAAGTTVTGQVCAYAVSPSGGADTLLGCRTAPGRATDVGVVVPSDTKIDWNAVVPTPANSSGIANYGSYPSTPAGCLNDGTGHSGLVSPAPVSATQTNQCLAWFRPVDSAVHPTIVYLHGGGWIGGNALPIHPQILKYVALGWTVVTVQYRFASCTTNQFPTPVRDVQDAIAYMKAHAASMGVDASRIVLFGHSAGAHLAELAGTGWNDTSGLLRSGPQYKVAGWVSLSGMSDMSYFAQKSAWFNLAFQFVPSVPSMGASCASGALSSWHPTPAVLNAVSPNRQLDVADPPGFMIHGGGDPVSIPGPSQPAMGAFMVGAGRPNAIWNEVVPNDGHNPAWNPTWLFSFFYQAASGVDPVPPV